MSLHGSEIDHEITRIVRVWQRRVELAIAWGVAFGVLGGIPIGFVLAWWVAA